MTDERTVHAPSDRYAWVEPGPSDAGGWDDDSIEIEQLRAEGRVVLEPGGDGRIEGVTGYVHRAEYMELMWIVQELRSVVSMLLDEQLQFGNQATKGKDVLDRTQPIRTREDVRRAEGGMQ